MNIACVQVLICECSNLIKKWDLGIDDKQMSDFQQRDFLKYKTENVGIAGL